MSSDDYPDFAQMKNPGNLLGFFMINRSDHVISRLTPSNRAVPVEAS
jgi:hypothetical protein